MPGHYVVGFGYDSSRIQDFSSALPGMSISIRVATTQYWAVADQMLVRNGKGDQDGIIALAGFINNNADNVVYAQQYFAGLLDRDFWQARPEDTIGLLFTYFAMSGPARQSSGSAGGTRSASQQLGHRNPDQRNGSGSQLQYPRVSRCGFPSGVPIRIRPNAQSNIRNAAVFGFKAHVEF